VDDVVAVVKAELVDVGNVVVVVVDIELVAEDDVVVVGVELAVEDNVVSFIELMDVVLISVGVVNEFTFA
jgi:hypothetical protein